MRASEAIIGWFLLPAVEAFIVSARPRPNGPLDMSAESATEPLSIPGRPTLHHSTLRIKDPSKSVPFYKALGYQLLDTFDVPQHNFSLYFMGDRVPELVMPGTQTAHNKLWTREPFGIMLLHNHETESEIETYSFLASSYTSDEYRRGLSCGTVSVGDFNATVETIESMGFDFSAEDSPDDWRVRGIAHVYDPDGYKCQVEKRAEESSVMIGDKFRWIELDIQHPENTLAYYRSMGVQATASDGEWGLEVVVDVLGEHTGKHEASYNWIKLYNKNEHLEKSLAFYGAMGMRPISVEAVYPFDDYADIESTYRLRSSNVPTSAEKRVHLDLFTEDDPLQFGLFQYEPETTGLGDLVFLVDDANEACAALRKLGYEFGKFPDDGPIEGLAVVYDPDGHSIGIVQRGKGIKFDFGTMTNGAH